MFCFRKKLSLPVVPHANSCQPREHVSAVNTVRAADICNCSRGEHLFLRRTVSAANTVRAADICLRGEQCPRRTIVPIMANNCLPRTSFSRSFVRREQCSCGKQLSAGEQAGEQVRGEVRANTLGVRPSPLGVRRSPVDVRRTSGGLCQSSRRKKRRTMAEFARSPLVFAWSPPMFAANTFSPAKLPIFGVKMP